MTQEHPITLSTELVKQWLGTYFGTTITGEVSDVELTLATQAARWGADQELEACCEWFLLEGWHPDHPNKLRAARRPKPPSLKEQALQALALLKVDASTHGLGFDSSTIRRALEALPD